MGSWIVGYCWTRGLRSSPTTQLTKYDLRKDNRALEKLKAKGASLVDLARAEEKGQELAAARVMECNAKTQVGLKDVFDEAIKVALAARAKPTRKKNGCMLL